MPGCSVFGCSNRHEQGYRMKPFPKDPVRRKLWALKLKRCSADNPNKLWFPNKRAFVCEVELVLYVHAILHSSIMLHILQFQLHIRINRLIFRIHTFNLFIVETS